MKNPQKETDYQLILTSKIFDLADPAKRKIIQEIESKMLASFSSREEACDFLKGTIQKGVLSPLANMGLTMLNEKETQLLVVAGTWEADYRIRKVEITYHEL